MDPITTAIMAVLPTLAGDTVKAAVKDAYDGLKAVIVRKWGESAPITKAIAAVEERPTSKARADVLVEEVEAQKANQDPDVAQALQKLLEEMKKHSIGGEGATNIHVITHGGTLIGIIGAETASGNTFNFGKT